MVAGTEQRRAHRLVEPKADQNLANEAPLPLVVGQATQTRAQWNCLRYVLIAEVARDFFDHMYFDEHVRPERGRHDLERPLAGDVDGEADRLEKARQVFIGQRRAEQRVDAVGTNGDARWRLHTRTIIERADRHIAGADQLAESRTREINSLRIDAAFEASRSLGTQPEPLRRSRDPHRVEFAASTTRPSSYRRSPTRRRP